MCLFCIKLQVTIDLAWICNTQNLHFIFSCLDLDELETNKYKQSILMYTHGFSIQCNVNILECGPIFSDNHHHSIDLITLFTLNNIFI